MKFGLNVVIGQDVLDTIKERKVALAKMYAEAGKGYDEKENPEDFVKRHQSYLEAVNKAESLMADAFKVVGAGLLHFIEGHEAEIKAPLTIEVVARDK